MSLFKRNPIVEIPKKDLTEFEIHQFVKIEGLKKRRH